MKQKKAQEEMVGFVIIMTIVLVILIIVLGLYIRQSQSQKTDNIELSQFLSSALEFTTKCEVSGTFLQLNELTQRCYEGNSCNSESACNMTKETFKELIESSWKFSPNSKTKGYRLDIRSSDIPLVIQDLHCALENQGISTTKVLPAKNSELLISLKICL